ncbi:GRF1-interacting factor 3 isoform X2 [Cannabis sativa]|uniref:GRF1-interacting factor 3 isoform X2 n=1 Tax=Cannabis sativa TaxID=3483 RepID=UPI0029CA55E9|nr:GRF1-interacting factor 3 isoform X2 [Cannabis sativa]
MQYLDENKKLILAILDNQHLGKLAECAQYQAQLQKNLMYLAAIADAQPQTPAMPPQMAPHPAMQQGGYFTQHPQAAAMMQQSGIFPPKMPMQFNNPHQMQQDQQQQQQQQQQPQQQQQQQQQQQHHQQQLHQQQQAAIHAQMVMRPAGTNNGMHPMHHVEATVGAGGSVGPNSAAGPNEGRGGGKQEGSEAGAAGADGQGTSAAGDGEDPK